MAEHHVQVETPNWDTKIRCSCGADFTSKCEFWKHGYEARALPEDMTSGKLEKLASVLDTYEPLLLQYFDHLLRMGRIMPHEHAHAKKILTGTQAQDDLRRWAEEIDE